MIVNIHGNATLHLGLKEDAADTQDPELGWTKGAIAGGSSFPLSSATALKYR